MGKKARTTLTIDAEILRKAHKIGLNVSQFCENALKEAVEALEQRKTKTMTNGGTVDAQTAGTFSMVARCQKTLTLGICVSTAVPAVGSRVPHIKAGVGAIATQAKTNIFYGINGLKLLKAGWSPQAALEAMLKEDPDRESRQVIIIDREGRTAAFSGKENVGWKGHFVGEDYVVAGNMLVGSQVIEAMAQTFKNSEGELAERLLKALEAGQEAGGDKRGRVSAALLVARKEQRGNRPILDLRVDEHSAPVKELRRIFGKKAAVMKRK